MPVRFRCHGCRRVLNAVESKIGQQVRCPGCGTSLVVPAVDDPPTAELPVLSMAASMIAPAETMPTANAATSPTASTSRSPAASWGSPPPLAPSRGDEFDSRGVFISRRMIVAQGMLLASVAAVAYTAGYFMARGNRDASDQPHTPEPIDVAGRIIIRSGDGALSPDEGAAVLIVPAERRPKGNRKPEGARLNPEAAALAAEDPMRAAIAAMGGAYERADAQGLFHVELPDRGVYRFVVVSRRLGRAGEKLDRIELAKIGDYVLEPIDFLGSRRYALFDRKLATGDTVDYEFDEQRSGR